MATKKKTPTKRRPRRSAAAEPTPTKSSKLVTIPGTDVEMEARTGPRHQFAPQPRPYVFDQDLCRAIATGVELDMNVLLTGPTGCGKTTSVQSLAAFLNRPYIRFNCNGETRVSSLRGQQKPATEDGVLTLKFCPGALVEAASSPDGWWILLDEIDAALPPVLFVLQSILEDGNRMIHVPETGETIVPRKDFRIFATGNTIGYRSSARAKHSGTNPMNDAFVDRFGMVVDVDYPTKAEEMERLKTNCPHVDEVVLEAITRVAAECRSDGRFRSDFSSRRCVHWARLADAFERTMPSDRAIYRSFQLAVVQKMTLATDAKVASEIMQRVTGLSHGG